MAVPYLMPYAASRHAHPPRTPEEVAIYSATPADYVRVPDTNVLRGAQVTAAASEERSLYPGAMAVGLALLGLWRTRSRLAWVYAGLALLAFDASLGVHGVTFRVLQAALPPLGNLRAPARFASLGLVALAALAAWGVSTVRQPRARAAVAAAAVLLCLVEFWSRPAMRDARLEPMVVDRWLATLPDDAVILELPVPNVGQLWGYETWHQVHSINHWRHLLNGYSGFIPTIYANTLIDMVTFPDERSLGRLRRLSVDYVVVRRINFTSDDGYARATAPLLAERAFGAPLVFGSGLGEAAVFALLPER